LKSRQGLVWGRGAGGGGGPRARRRSNPSYGGESELSTSGYGRRMKTRFQDFRKYFRPLIAHLVPKQYLPCSPISLACLLIKHNKTLNPYVSVHKLVLLLGMKALKFHMLHMFAFDESHDLVMIPISLHLTTWRSCSCSRRTSTSTIGDCYCWIVLYKLHWIICDLIATLYVFVRWICVMLKYERS
jgi:hypothetical protein